MALRETPFDTPAVGTISAATAGNLAAGIGVAATVFALSYANGGFDATTKAYAGIVAWWFIGLGAATGVASSSRFGVDRLTRTTIVLLAGFAVWVLISMQWASDAGRAFEQFDQISLYVAVLIIAVALARVVPVGVIVGGAALGLTGVACVALVSRLFPSSFGVQPGVDLIPALAARLSFPVGYWNGLAVEVALAYPLLLAIMTSRRSRALTAAAALPLPVIAAVMYLAASRGGFVAAGVGMVVYLALTPRRWAAAAAVAVAGVGGAAAVATIVHKKDLVNGHITALAASQGHRAALLIGAVCVVSALLWLGLDALGRRLPTPPRAVGIAAVAIAGVLVIAALVASHPVRKFDEFKHVAFTGQTASTLTTGHLLGSSGSGRWQTWTAALTEFRAHPLNGGGAGSFAAWWLQHGTLAVFTKTAHSLYLEALAELGIIGFLLLAGAVVAGLWGAVRSALVLKNGEVAAAAACGITFFAAAAYDWVWQLAGVAVVGVGMLGVALGSHPASREPSPSRIGFGRPALAILAVGAVITQFVVLAAGVHLRNSQAAVAANDGARARIQALAARAIEPWSSAPYLQIALIYEAEHHYDLAARWINSALARSPHDWSLWYVAAQIEKERGHVEQAKRDLARARQLDPHSPLLRHSS